MYVVILGAGVIGTSLARWLVSNDHEVAVVEISPARCEDMDEELGSVTVRGDGTLPGVLADAGIGRADAFVATTGRDEDNLAACQLAAHHFNVRRTVSLVNLPEHEGLFTALGVTSPISVPDLVMARVQEDLAIQGMVHLMPVQGDTDRTLVAIKVPPESAVAGRSLKDIALPDGTLISLVISRDGTMSIPGEDTTIQPEDELVAVTTGEEEEALRELLTKQSSE